jgi:hypothetical protein
MGCRGDTPWRLPWPMAPDLLRVGVRQPVRRRRLKPTANGPLENASQSPLRGLPRLRTELAGTQLRRAFARHDPCVDSAQRAYPVFNAARGRLVFRARRMPGFPVQGSAVRLQPAAELPSSVSAGCRDRVFAICPSLSVSRRRDGDRNRRRGPRSWSAIAGRLFAPSGVAVAVADLARVPFASARGRDPLRGP